MLNFLKYEIAAPIALMYRYERKQDGTSTIKYQRYIEAPAEYLGDGIFQLPLRSANRDVSGNPTSPESHDIEIEHWHSPS